MQIKVRKGVIATHTNQGESRRMLFITPWGCSFDEIKTPPENVDLSEREYTVDVSGDVAAAIRNAIREGHAGIKENITILENKKQAGGGKHNKRAKGEPAF